MALMEFVDGRHFIGIWFVGDGKTCDWLSTAFKDPGEIDWHVRYRFRHYESNDAWDGKDIKNAYEAFLPGTEEDVERLVGKMAEMMGAVIGGAVQFVPMHSNDARANVASFSKAPWAHSKTIKKRPT